MVGCISADDGAAVVGLGAAISRIDERCSKFSL